PARPPADLVMRRLLRIPDGPNRATEDGAHRLFSVSIVLSALRCLLSYVFLPILVPVLGVAAGVGPIVGIPVGILALVFDVLGIRRFWLVDHRYRWGVSLIYVIVMVMVASLVGVDVAHLA
ncbi:MAG: hypothetical protein ACRD0J_12325, partial [Acidimicrobiales bacterium]